MNSNWVVAHVTGSTVAFKRQGVTHNGGGKTVVLDTQRTRHRVDKTCDFMVLGEVKQHGGSTRKHPLAVWADFSKRISGMIEESRSTQNQPPGKYPQYVLGGHEKQESYQKGKGGCRGNRQRPRRYERGTGFQVGWSCGAGTLGEERQQPAGYNAGR